MAENVKYKFIQNVGDYFPSGYFSEDFIDKVQKASGLNSDQMTELCKPYVKLRGEYEKYKNYILNTHPRVKDAIKHTHDFHTQLLNILGYDTTCAYQQFITINEDDHSVVPVRHILTRNGKTTMLVMEMQHLIKTDEQEPAGLFEQQYNVVEDGQTSSVIIRHQQYYAGQWSELFTLPKDEEAHISPAVINKAIDAIFLLPEEHRPHFILMMAGNTMFLLDSDKWNRGSYLEFSMDELFSQASISAFRKYYALFHLLICKDTLAADSESVLMDKLVEESYKSAYEVTKDLKEGVILSVETLANEALWYWKKELTNSDTTLKSNPLSSIDYTDDTFEAEVKDDCLNIIYRLLFIFYAESRDELDILPTKDEVYKDGYSLEMLRDLEKAPMRTEESRNGYFFNDSLNDLFWLLANGYRQGQQDNKSFSVRKIDSPLFDNRRLHHLKDVKIRNIEWQKIIRALSLSNRDKQVGRISYANLGVNQLGSVYESLLAYRGFYAEQDYIEVHKVGKPEEGTFLVPYSRMDDFEADEILCDEQGEPKILPQGTFVYRLNGRDRQKSASYYTPEVLTRSTVKYTLKSILDEVAEGKRKAQDLLDLKILEPAMGAAAFQNEVINQLAEAYLTYQQQQRHEAGFKEWRIAPDHYRDELQKVKAYIATHNVYGVDLNPTAIELGKLSLWLNVIHKDMETPFFSNRLALGNAVIGAWLKVYDKKDIIGHSVTVKGKYKLLPNEWWTKAPHKIHFNKVNFENGKVKSAVKRSVNEIYHFLLPDKNMLAVRSIKDVFIPADATEEERLKLKETRKAQIKGMKEMLDDWTAPISSEEFQILQRISAKIDKRLLEYFTFQWDIERLTNNKTDLWGIYGQTTLEFGSLAENYAEKERLNDTRYRHNNAYFILKNVMDYWCALWFWEFDDAHELPTRREFWSDIETILQVKDEDLNARTKRALQIYVEKDGQLGFFGENHQNDLFAQAKYENMAHEDPHHDEDTDLEDNDEVSELKTQSKEEILGDTQGAVRTFFDDSMRFKTVKKYADRYHFFHPMLEFIEVFWLRDGFDIICGNPPWIKLEFNEANIISDKYPEVAIRKVSAPDVRQRINDFLGNPAMRDLYTSEQYENVGSTAFLNAYCNYPLLVGQQTNLYKCVLENTMDLASEERGFIGLLTPESIYDDPKGQPLRRELYKRLRYHFQYQNELRLFAEVDHHTVYGDQLLGPRRSSSPRFASLSNLFHPNTVDACFAHDGYGSCGGIKDENGNWNTAAHKDRVVEITDKELQVLSDTFEDGTTGDCAKLVSIHSKEIIDVLNKIQKYPKHVSSKNSIILECLHETGAVDEGIISREINTPTSDYELIYSGPHFYVANPLYKTPRTKCILNSDYDNLLLERITASFNQRSNYKRKMRLELYCQLFKGFKKERNEEGESVYDNWLDYYKIGFRKMLSIAGERSLICAVLRSKSAHINGVISISFLDRYDTVDMAALCASIVMDFYIKTVGSSNLQGSRMQSFPLGVAEKYQSAMYSRTLLLNCLTVHYADLWQSCWRPEYAQEEWSLSDPRLKPFTGLTEEWTWDTPLRNYFERRQALVEIDVLAAMALGLSLKDLELIYTIQFPVLQQNENDTWYDAKGNIVFTCSKGLNGVGCERKEWESIRGNLSEDSMTYEGTEATYIHTIDPKKSEMYGGEQVTYYAPYTKCDRIADYRRAWAFFENRL